MDIPTPEELVAKIEAFIARHEMAETRFGRDAVRDPNLLSDLRAGQRLPGLTKLSRIAAFMRQKDADLSDPCHVGSDTIGAADPSSGNLVEVSARDADECRAHGDCSSIDDEHPLPAASQVAA